MKSRIHSHRFAGPEQTQAEEMGNRADFAKLMLGLGLITEYEYSRERKCDGTPDRGDEDME